MTVVNLDQSIGDLESAVRKALKKIDRLQAQRDELLAAMNSILGLLGYAQTSTVPGGLADKNLRAIEKQAYAAIRKAQEGL